MAANSGAIIADIFPPERRNRAYGYNALGWGIGAVLGLLVGAAIVTYWSWRWAFWINVPVGALGVALAFKFLHDTGPRPKDRLDIVGIVTLALGLFGILVAITRLATSSLSVTTTGLRLGTFSLDAPTTGLLVGGVVMLGVFVAVELRKDERTLGLSLLRIPTVTPTLLAALLQCLANFAVVFLVIMFLQGARQPVDYSCLAPGGPRVLGGDRHRPAGGVARRPRWAGHPGHSRARRPGCRGIRVLTPIAFHRALGGCGRQRAERYRRQRLLARQRGGLDNGREA